MKRHRNRDAEALIAERAQEWLERLERKDNPTDRADFLAWLKESPIHVREVLFASTFDKVLGYMIDPEHDHDIGELLNRNSSNVIPLGSDTAREPAPVAVELDEPSNMGSKRNGWPTLTRMMVAACMVIALGFGGAKFVLNSEPQLQFNTVLGEQRSVGLSDGSIIHMNTQSRIRTAFSDEARDIYLIQGQAIFKVRHDPVRPFRVHVGSTVVQAIGTQFDVRRLKDRTNVAVIEGVVQIISGAERKLDATSLAKLPANTRVPAGESVVIIADGGLMPHMPVSAEDATAWQQRRLVFHDQTLGEIASEFNRYNRMQIRVEGDALRERRFSVVFDADDTQSLLDYLFRDKHIVVDRRNEELVIRHQSNGLVQARPPL